jgi:hypothetical protein
VATIFVLRRSTGIGASRVDECAPALVLADDAKIVRGDDDACDDRA